MLMSELSFDTKSTVLCYHNCEALIRPSLLHQLSDRQHLRKKYCFYKAQMLLNKRSNESTYKDQLIEYVPIYPGHLILKMYYWMYASPTSKKATVQVITKSSS